MAAETVQHYVQPLENLTQGDSVSQCLKGIFLKIKNGRKGNFGKFCNIFFCNYFYFLCLMMVDIYHSICLKVSLHFLFLYFQVDLSSDLFSLPLYRVV